MKYLDFLVARSKGLIPTGASFLRNLAMTHPGYGQDSVVNSEMIYDLCTVVAGLEDPDSKHRQNLLGLFASTEIN